jgi:hypothetical protein
MHAKHSIGRFDMRRVSYSCSVTPFFDPNQHTTVRSFDWLKDNQRVFACACDIEGMELARTLIDPEASDASATAHQFIE